MTVYRRLKRRLGYDTTVVESRTVPEYEYTVTHLNGNVNTVRGHGYNTDGAFATFYRYTDVDVMKGVLGPSYSVWQTGQETLRRLEGIEEIEREHIGQTEIKAVIDSADDCTLETECRFGALEVQ